jgi:glutamate-1-semialdehyde 2,1-aminomutase
MASRADLVQTFMDRTPKSRAEYEKARRSIPGGVGSAVQYMTPYPLYVAHSEGSKVWDLDGNEYIDFSMCFAAMIAGHAHPAIVDAITLQARKGTLYGMPTALASEVAAELQRRYPVLERIRFTQSGVEAVTYALRLARAATRKDKFIKIEGGYHGASDDVYISTHPQMMEMAGPAWNPVPVVQSMGARSDAVEHVVIVPFNDLDAMERALTRYRGEIACVLMEPVMTNGGVIPPQDGYLQGVRELTRAHNVLMLLDEVKVGCRVAPGGATELYGLEPDLIVLAKAIGGGTSLGAFGGRADLMGMVSPEGPVGHAGTYNANPLVMAAARACLQDVLTDGSYDHLRALGDRLAAGQRRLVERHRIPASVPQVGPLGGLIFTADPPRNYRDARRCDKELWTDYWFGMLNRGVIPMGCAWSQEWSISVAHTEADIDRTLGATDEVLASLTEAQLA